LGLRRGDAHDAAADIDSLSQDLVPRS
jgi:hypothetical protein